MAKVIFLHLSVIHSTHRGGLVPGGSGPGGVSNFSGGCLQFFGEGVGLQFFGGLQFYGGVSNCFGGDTVNVRPVRILLECILVNILLTVLDFYAVICIS